MNAAFMIELRRPDGSYTQMLGISAEGARQLAVDGVYVVEVTPDIRVRVLVDSPRLGTSLSIDGEPAQQCLPELF